MSHFAHKMLEMAFFVAPAIAFRLDDKQKADYAKLTAARDNLERDYRLVCNLSGAAFKARAKRLAHQITELDEIITDLKLSARIG